MKRMKYTEENSNIMHEIGHFIMYTLWISQNKEIDRNYFNNRIFEISIVENENSFGRVVVNNKISVDTFCVKLTYLSGVLFSLGYVEHPDMLWWFDDKWQIKKNFIEVYNKFGGSSDLLWILKNIRAADSNYIAIYIYELKKFIQIIRKDETIRKIVHQLYKGLQKNKHLSGDQCYSIIKPHIQKLKILGRQIYNPITKIKINAKAILF